MSYCHHAHIITSRKSIPKDKMLEVIGFDLNSTAQVELKEYSFSNFTVDDARSLIEETSLKKLNDGVLIFVLNLERVQLEAQNALLKLIEEPQDGLMIVICIADTINILPTIISRVNVVNHVGELDTDVRESVVKMSTAKRLEYVAKIAENYKKEKISKSEIVNIVDAIIEDVRAKRGGEDIRQIYNAHQMLKKYIFDNGASVKVLLEYFVLSI